MENISIDLTKAKKDTFNKNFRKENHFYKSLQLVVVENNKIKVPIDVRFYATNSKHYCCFWCYYKEVRLSGSGYIKGYAYDKGYRHTEESASFSDALNRCGINTDHLTDIDKSDIDGWIYILGKIIGIKEESIKTIISSQA